MDGKKRWNNITFLIWAGINIYIIVMLLNLLCFHIYNTINSDMSSELVLANQLARERGWVLSDNWYYSTELRVVNTQLISAFLFRFTENWQLVRVLTAAILYLICGGAIAFLGQSLGWKKKNIILCEFLLLVPYSSTYLSIVQFGMFYYPHIILMFLGLGCFFNSGDKKIYILFWVIISFFMGLGGLRYLLIMHIPMLLAGSILLAKEKSFWDLFNMPVKGHVKRLLATDEAYRLAVVAGGCIAAGSGYVILDKLLSVKFIFQKFDNLRYCNLGEKGDSITDIFGRVIMGIPEILGFRYNVPLISAKGILNVFALFFVLIIVICLWVLIRKALTGHVNLGVQREDDIYRDKYAFDFMVLLFLCSFLANIYVFVFTGNYTSRYWIPVLIWLIPILVSYINQIKNPTNMLRICTMGILCYIFINGMSILNDALKNDGSANRYGVNQYLISQDMNVGYSTFWNANVTTEMTNGQIKMLPINSERDLTIYKWLTPRDFYYDDRQMSKGAFILLSREEAERVHDTPLYNQGLIGYMDDSFVVFVFNREYLESQIVY